MDIDTGSVEDIYTVPQHTFGFPFELHAEGNYVYYYLKANTTDYGWFAYDIEKKEAGHTPWDIAYAEKNGIELKEKKSVFTLPDAENDRYGFKIGFSTDKVQGKDYTDVSELTDDDLVLKIYPYKKYDTEPLLDKAFTLDVKRSEMRIPGPVMLYEDKLIYAGDNKTVVCGIGEDNWGQKLGEFSYESSYDQYIAEVGKYSSATGDFAQKFHLVNGKLYKVVRAGMDDQLEHYYSFYSCDIDSILKGNGEWKLEFTNKWPG